MHSTNFESKTINEDTNQNPNRNANNVGNIVLLTKVNCPDCKKFKPEWIKFMEYFERHHAHLFLPNFIQHLVYDASATNAVEKRNEILQFAEEGVDKYPILLFYIGGNGTNGRHYRWKPYWFNAAPFRTAPALIFSFVILFRIANAMHKALTTTAFSESKDESESEREKIEEGRQCLKVLPQLQEHLQADIDAHYTAEDRAHPNYPTFEKVFTLYVPTSASVSTPAVSVPAATVRSMPFTHPYPTRTLVPRTNEPERAPTEKELGVANSY